jgi:exonuclease III
MKPFNLLFLLFILVVNISLFSQEHRIILDEIYSDWDNISEVSDSNDASTLIDLYTLKVTNYGDFLFLLVEMNTEINLQDLNSITLYIDSDNNSSTGFSINGIGAELEYKFGDRNGRFYYDNTSKYISHKDIGLITLPTVTSNIFEMNINLNSIIDGHILFPDSTIRVIIKDNVLNGDIIPNENGGYLYNFENNLPQLKLHYSIKKLDESNLRIVTYNVERDNLFETSNKEAHRRIFNAIDPDIIGFQEIYNHTAQQTADLIGQFLPPNRGEIWYSSKVGSDIITVSRYPISNNFAIDNNAAFIIDLEEHQRELLFISAHTPCCDNNDSRQREIDNFMSFIREAKEEGGVLTLEKDSPIVVVGDMNLVGYNQQQKTLVTGNIVNTNIYGEAFLPDWDSTHFTDSKPITTHMPSTFTWYNEGSSFSPGRLDYVVYSNSVMSVENSYALFTKALPQDSLTLHNLERNDVTSVADHIPVIVDFKFSPMVSVTNNSDLDYAFSLSQNYPNPFNPTTTIKYSISVGKEMLRATYVQLKIYDILGREVAILVNEHQVAGNYEVKFDAGKLTSGNYFYTLSSSGKIESKKMLLIK